MSSNQTAKIFICSYCEQSIKFQSEQEGKRVQCPKCKKPVWVFENRFEPISPKLNSTWMYERPKLLGLLGSRMVGPITDTEFLELMQTGELDRDSFVKSPELTRNQEIEAGRVNLSVVRDMCNQRAAEEQRLRNLHTRATQRDAKNRETLVQGIKKAISDGNLSLNERTQLHAFANKAGITVDEVDEILKRESSALLRELIEEAIADGFFDDQESESISKFAIGLGLTLAFTKDQQFRLSLARSAWNLLQQLRSGSLQQSLVFDGAELFEIVSLKRPSGIALGDDHYLKSIGTGTIKRIEKNLLLDGRLIAKKYALSSIVTVRWYSDGLFLKRSSGKSLFICPVKTSLAWHQFAMAMEVLSTGEPVVGVLPDETFIPGYDIEFGEFDGERTSTATPPADDDLTSDDWTPAFRVPRFTFRVVGEAHENRHLDLNRLRIGDNVYLNREPKNPYDPNAVAVVNLEKRTLGHLKREVSVWFAPILDKGRQFQCEVKQRTSSGGIIIAVFD
ncbi:MAG: HIRAN domain-containing protein [Pirellula sp.]|nr:HIRAN domain-containing protein [Pirellula sp.]